MPPSVIPRDRLAQCRAMATLVCAATVAGCGSSTPSPHPSAPTRSDSPTTSVHASTGEHLHLSGVLVADVQVAVVADCPATGPGLRLIFDAGGRRWDLGLVSQQALANKVSASPGTYDLSDPTQGDVFLDPYKEARPQPFTPPTPGPVEHFNAQSGTLTVSPDRQHGTVQAALVNADDGPVDVTVTPSPPVTIEHLDGTWSC